MRKHALSMAIVAAVAIAAPQALAFGTVRMLGQNAEHERITRKGLEGLGFGDETLSQLAGADRSFGAVGAPDKPSRGLMSDKAAHCDGGDYFNTTGYAQSQAKAQAQLTACRTWIMSKIDEAVTDAGGLVRNDLSVGGAEIADDCPFNGKKGLAKCNVLEDLGLVFHAAQDFYSHSNWVDAERSTPSIDNPAGLNNNAPAPWLSPAGAAFPAGLISGCYEGFPEFFHCGGRIKHTVLNKDTAGTDRGDYAKAMNVAALDTRNKWAFFENQLVARYGPARGAKMACVVKSDSPGKC